MTTRQDAHLFERAAEWMAARAADPQAPLPANGAARATAPDAPCASSSDAPHSLITDAPRAPAADTPGALAIDVAILEAAGLAMAGPQRSRTAEEWRVTASHLLRGLRAARQDAPPQALSNLLMVTSAKPNEGKSFSSLNLCGRMGQDRMVEVLLLDADSKPGGLSDLLGQNDRPGLFDLVTDPTARVETMIVRTAVPGLTFLPVGRRPPDEPHASGRNITRPVVTAIEALARRFADRVLVLDTPPCLATSDASSLAPAVTMIAVVIEAERTQRNDLEAALEMLRPCRNISLVLNKMRQGGVGAFGHYDYYYG